jgi:hypothetical protein
VDFILILAVRDILDWHPVHFIALKHKACGAANVNQVRIWGLLLLLERNQHEVIKILGCQVIQMPQVLDHL